MTWADELAGQGGEVTEVGGGQGTPHLGEKPKSPHPVGSGLSYKNEMSSHAPGSSFMLEVQGNGKSRNQQK